MPLSVGQPPASWTNIKALVLITSYQTCKYLNKSIWNLLITMITTCLNRKLHGKGLPLKWVDDIKRVILYVFDEVISVLSLEVVVCLDFVCFVAVSTV